MLYLWFMLKPPHLKPGDQVSLLCTARKISEAELAPAKRILESWGLQVVYGKNLFQIHHQFAGTAAQRTSDFQDALNDPNCKAIICARGGYGSVQIVDELDFSVLNKYPKWLVGYSDVTTIHCHLQAQFQVESLHATMPISFPKEGSEDSATSSLRKALFGYDLDYTFEANASSQLRDETITGTLLGGNLSILYSLTGTASQPNTAGCILFMEDLDEYLYHIDRMMCNLDRAGMLANCKAILVGGMSDMNDNAVAYGYTAEEIICNKLSPYQIPVITGFPAGHIPDNRALVMGRETQITIQGNQIHFLQHG